MADNSPSPIDHRSLGTTICHPSLPSYMLLVIKHYRMPSSIVQHDSTIKLISNLRNHYPLFLVIIDHQLSSNVYESSLISSPIIIHTGRMQKLLHRKNRRKTHRRNCWNDGAALEQASNDTHPGVDRISPLHSMSTLFTYWGWSNLNKFEIFSIYSRITIRYQWFMLANGPT